jgi:hypothetical protein
MYMDEQATSEVALMDEQVRSTPSIATFDRVAHRSIQAIARRAVPALGDFAMVFMVAGRSINGIACAHISPAGNRILRALQRIYRIRRDDLRSTVAQVIRTGRPSLRRSIQDDEQPARRGQRRRPASAPRVSIGLWCSRFHIGHQVAGAVTLCYAGSGRTYAPADLAGAQRVAREIARTILLPMPHAAAPRLRAAVGDARRQPHRQATSGCTKLSTTATDRRTRPQWTRVSVHPQRERLECRLPPRSRTRRWAHWPSTMRMLMVRWLGRAARCANRFQGAAEQPLAVELVARSSISFLIYSCLYAKHLESRVAPRPGR